MKRAGFGILALAVAMAPAQSVFAQELATMDAVGNKLMDCWSPPAGSQGSAVTLRFSFRRDGSLIGAPRATHVDVEGDEDARKAFVDAAVESLQDCAPVTLSDTLARGIGGKVFLMTFRGGGDAAIQAGQ